MYCYRVLNKFKFLLCEINAIIVNLCLYLTPVVVSLLITKDLSLNSLFVFIVYIIISNIIYAAGNHFWTVNVNDFLASFVKDVEVSYFKRIINMPLHKLNTIHSGYLKKQIDIIGNESRNFLGCIMDNINGSLIAGIIFLVSVYLQNKMIFMLCLFMLGFIVLFNLYMSKKTLPRQKAYNDTYSKYTSVLTDLLQNMKTIKKLDADDYSKDKIHSEYVDVNHKLHYLNLCNSIRFNGIDIIISIMYVIILIDLYFQMKNGTNIISFIVFYITMFTDLKGEFRRLSNVFQTYNTLVSANEQVETIIGNFEEAPKINNWHTIELKDINFKYSEKSKKEIIIPYFKIRNKDKISIIGKSGQGKTTFLNILSRFLDVPSDHYLIDGKSKKGNLDIAYISQDVDLLNVSILENICLGKKISTKKLENILKDADLYDWINDLPDKLNTIVGERGLRLSAGQKQRINIIRGIILDKKVYILDEPTSNLDDQTESDIIKLIDKYLKDKTVVIVTHRLSVQKICTKHYQFDQGIMKNM